LAKEVWQFVAKQAPDWVFDLHEGFDFNGINPRSVGSSVIAFPDQSVLGQLDTLVFPGGSGSAQDKAIGEERRRDVRDFVRQGGGIVGICAGAYLCSSHYDWSLDLMNAAVFNTTLDIPGQGRKSMWYRGPATDVEVALTERESEVLGVEGTQLIRYHNRPILSRGEAADLPAYVPLAHFRSENGLYPQQKNTMIGAPAVVFAQYGAGRVLAISPHFESTPDSKHVVERAVRHVQRTTPPARGTAMPCTD
jgi:hypothetical protein